MTNFNNPVGGQPTNAGFLDALHDNNPSFKPLKLDTEFAIFPSTTNPSSTTQTNPTQPTVNQNPVAKVENSKYEVSRLLNDPRERMRIDEMARELKSSFKNLGPDSHGQIKQVLEGLKPEEAAALEVAYGQLDGRNEPAALRNDIRQNLSNHSFNNVAKAGGIVGGALAAAKVLSKGGKFGKIAGGILAGAAALFGGATAINGAKNIGFSDHDAISILNKGAKCHPEVASVALREAMEGSGTDEKCVKDILTNSSDQFLTEVAFDYKQKFGTSLSDQIRGDFNHILGGPEKEYTGRIIKALQNSDYRYQNTGFASYGNYSFGNQLA